MEDIFKILHESQVPSHLHGGIERYIKYGIPPGSFITAVIENNLVEALGQADAYSRAGLFEVVSWFYNYAPSPCWGSPQKMKEWKGTKTVNV